MSHYEEQVRQQSLFSRSPKKAEGLKDDGLGGTGDIKPRWELLPLDVIEEAVKVLTVGAQKYAPDSWQGVNPERYAGALMRHFAAWRKGSKIDEDLANRGCRVSHMACVLCNAIFLLWGDLQEQPGRPLALKEMKDE